VWLTLAATRWLRRPLDWVHAPKELRSAADSYLLRSGLDSDLSLHVCSMAVRSAQ
jgi:hypothetical protein